MIQELLSIPYKQYARGRDGADCWGIVCIARKILRGDDLPLYEHVQDKRALTKAAHDFFASGFVETDTPVAGTIAAVWHGRVCVHVGIVLEIDGRLAVLDSDEGRGPSIRWKPDFERSYLKVSYHDNQN